MIVGDSVEVIAPEEHLYKALYQNGDRGTILEIVITNNGYAALNIDFTTRLGNPVKPNSRTTFWTEEVYDSYVKVIGHQENE